MLWRPNVLKKRTPRSRRRSGTLLVPDTRNLRISSTVEPSAFNGDAGTRRRLDPGHHGIDPLPKARPEPACKLRTAAVSTNRGGKIAVAARRAEASPALLAPLMICRPRCVRSSKRKNAFVANDADVPVLPGSNFFFPDKALLFVPRPDFRRLSVIRTI